MRRKTYLVIVFVLIIGALKYAGVEVQTGQAEAASEAPLNAKVKTETQSKLDKHKSKIAAVASKKTSSPPAKKINEQKTKTEDSIPLRRVTDQEIYCRLLAAGVNVDDKNLKLSHDRGGYTDSGDYYFTAYVQTSSCPQGSFSRYEIGPDGKLNDAIDCNDMNKETMALTSASQRAIQYVADVKGQVSAALSGDGMFVIRCENEIRYSRRGEWSFNPDQTLSTPQGNCQVLDRQGRVFHLKDESDLNDEGCNSQRECLAIVNPQAGEFQVLDRETFLATNESPKHLDPAIDDVRFFQKSLEETEDPHGGLLGPNFEALRVLDKPAWCPKTF